MTKKRINHAMIHEAVVFEEWQLMKIAIMIDSDSVLLFLKIRNSKENRKLYIDKLKSLDKAILEEIYDYHYAGLFTVSGANFCVSETEYNQSKQ